MKKTSHHTIFFFGILFSTFVLVGCLSKTESKLIGKWKLEPMLSDSAEKKMKVCTWTFVKDGKALFVNETNTNLHSDSVIGEYSLVSKKVVNKYIKIRTPKGLAGTWRIEKLTGKVLIINRIELDSSKTVAAYLRREFTKK